MKIVHCIFSFCVGGAETMLVDIMNHQCVDHDVTLIVVNDQYDTKLLQTISPEVEVLKFERKAGAFPLHIFLKLNYMLRRLNPDIIHVHDHKLLGLIRMLDKKIVYTVHCTGVQLEYLRKHMLTVAISDSVKKDLTDRSGGNCLIVTIPNGIDIGKIKYIDHSYPAGKRTRIINVGRLNHSIKGQHLLIQAVSLLRKQGYDVSMDFIGEGESLDYLKGLSRELGVEDSVNFLGIKNRDYIYEHLADYDIMCHPSIYEGFGLTVAEGIAAGLPVVVSTGDGPYEIIGQGKFGTAFENGNAKACAQAIKSVIDNYPEAQQKAASAREHVMANYSIEAMVQQYNHYYQNRCHRQ